MWLPLTHPRTGDLARNPGMCPDWESNLRPFGSQAGAQSTEPHHPGQGSVLNHNYLPAFKKRLVRVLGGKLSLRVSPNNVFQKTHSEEITSWDCEGSRYNFLNNRNNNKDVQSGMMSTVSEAIVCGVTEMLFCGVCERCLSQ